MNSKLKSSFDSFEVSISSFFQKIPELLVLIAIPLALAFHIFLRQQPVKEKAYIAPNTIPATKDERNVQSELESKLGVIEKIIQGSSEGANISSPSATLRSDSSVIPKLDLVGPWSCAITDAKGGSKKLYIENKSLKLVTQKGSETSHVLLKDNCLYSWVNNGPGVKQCEGVSDMLQLAEMAISMGITDTSSVIFEMTSNADGSISDLVNTCKKAQSGVYIFTIPQGIKWTEDSTLLESLQK